jgi:hypothetical protein
MEYTKDDLKFEWHQHYSAGLTYCVNEIRIRATNLSGASIKGNIDCRLDGRKVAPSSFKLAPTQRKVIYEPSLISTPHIAAVSCLLAIGPVGRADWRSVSASDKTASDGQLVALLTDAGVPLSMLRSLQDESQIRSQSKAIVNSTLDRQFRLNTNAPIPLADRVGRALETITSLRGEHGYSTNPQLRNAEYYLHGLFASISGDPAHIIQTYGATFYDSLKRASGDNPFLRVDANNPNSAPGGARWARAGLEDGKSLRNEEGTNKPEGHGLNLIQLARQ